MAYSIIIKDKAESLRKNGFSINEIHTNLKVSKGRISEWVRDVKMLEKGKKRLFSKIKKSQIVASENKKLETEKTIKIISDVATDLVGGIKYSRNLSRVFCSLIYLCEGIKSLYSCVNFTNSDPQLVSSFLYLFRKSFKVDNSKFRVCVHLHEYHNRNRQLKFWSGITKIPLRQFIKPFSKANTGKRIRKNYNGCVSVRYYDVNVNRQLLMIARAFLEKRDI